MRFSLHDIALITIRDNTEIAAYEADRKAAASMAIAADLPGVLDSGFSAGSQFIELDRSALYEMKNMSQAVYNTVRTNYGVEIVDMLLESVKEAEEWAVFRENPENFAL